ncbi:MAG: hypothetical protein PHQ66_03375 [Candidatus Nanoarchaeia archaeon]|nr:hypothetical protein [Candidatus Nanoarchaeia archaeon]MDD5357597.1 hypothetical protein [Candidatus Nanoarchaeia archaeon]MDD5588516.1 hypothetical protein [Candidatus Nanoarchaeia archaeon]
MKKPYVKKFSKIANFTVWIVDGKYIRDNIDEEFTNFGQHYRFNFIPKDELWIDREGVPGEEKFYINYLLAENRFMAKGISYSNAVDKANIIEKKERKKDYLMKKGIETQKRAKEDIEFVHKNLLEKYSNKKVKVWIVDGEAVRDLFYVDFTEGGHGYVYPFVPKDEVWIDDDLTPREIKFVLLHELHERALMAGGMEYDTAHKSSSEIEYYCRKNLAELDKNLKKAILENNNA